MSDGTFDGDHTMRFERRVGHPVERVWDAITDPRELAGWLGRLEGDLAPGAAVVLTWLNTDEHGNGAVMSARVTGFEPPRLLELSGDIHGTLRFALAPDGDGTVLRFSVDMVPESLDGVERYLAGWHLHLDHLEALLGGDPVDWPTWWDVHEPQWRVLRDRYAAGAESAARPAGERRAG